MNIGLTGGIAAGKSTVADLLVRKGALLVDLDRIAREIVEPGQPALERIAERFGQAVLQADGTLDRKKLGAMVFADPDKRKALEQITHPAIRAVMKERMEANRLAAPDRLTVVDVPLLYESGLASYFEKVLVVYVPRRTQLERLIARDKLSPEEAEIRLNAQMDIEEKKKRADYVIDNGGSLEETERQVDAFWREMGLA
ncbi:dephospho-CoA kinase [Cohnella caldifontis]|uniref:dephospho-CoA kinase n=1 Tax=Cohnella caldifontis TaxID=3027471 RepID=UPI0023EB56EA|nr:dephospho-CoA kinase [Cohnella sp. YIM B05605]